MQLRLEVREHIAGRRTDAAGAGEGVQVPPWSWLALAIVTLHQSAKEFGRERNRRVLHSERTGDLALHEVGIAGPRASGQRRAQYRETEIAIGELLVRRLRDAVPLDEIVEIGGMIVGELLADVALARVIGHAWHSRMVSGQVEQGNFESPRRGGDTRSEERRVG